MVCRGCLGGTTLRALVRARKEWTTNMSQDDPDVEAIRRRWVTADSALKWHTIPANRRERVLAELEENAREAATLDPTLASDLNAALDVLDTPNNTSLLELFAQAQADLRALLRQTR